MKIKPAAHQGEVILEVNKRDEIVRYAPCPVLIVREVEREFVV
jgi:hypothetical protein